MHTDVSTNAPAAVLLFLGALLFFAACLAFLVHGLLAKKPSRVKAGLTAAAAGAGLYASLLLAASLASKETVLLPGEEKHFCEVDCHLAYTVAGVRTAPPAATLPHRGFNPLTLVTLRVRFDETTIAPGRGDGPLYPNPRSAALVLPNGRTVDALPEALAALAVETRPDGSLRDPLRPGESRLVTLVFEAPESLDGARLLLRGSAPETAFLIGHENSPLHGKTYFALRRS